jgi:hypothetical protein
MTRWSTATWSISSLAVCVGLKSQLYRFFWWRYHTTSSDGLIRLEKTASFLNGIMGIYFDLRLSIFLENGIFAKILYARLGFMIQLWPCCSTHVLSDIFGGKLLRWLLLFQDICVGNVYFSYNNVHVCFFSKNRSPYGVKPHLTVASHEPCHQSSISKTLSCKPSISLKWSPSSKGFHSSDFASNSNKTSLHLTESGICHTCLNVSQIGLKSPITDDISPIGKVIDCRNLS